MSDPQNPYNRAYQPTQSYPAAQQGPPDQPYPAAPTSAGQPHPYPQAQAYPQDQPYGPGQPYPAPYPPYGPQGHPYGGPGPVQPRNGFGTTALVLALVGLALAFVPFTGFLAVILGGLAVVFGLLGLGRVRSGQATNKVMAIVGAVLGLVAMVIGVIATVLVVSAAVRFASEQQAAGASGPAAPTPSLAAPPPPQSPSSPSSAPAAPNRQTGPAPGTFTWEDGLAVEVSAPRAVTFSETACCRTSGSGIAFTIRLTNNTGKIVEPYAVQTSLTIDGVNSEQVFDTERSFGGLSDPVAPGQTLTVDVAFDGTGSSLVLEIGGFPYDDALFTATL